VGDGFPISPCDLSYFYIIGICERVIRKCAMPESLIVKYTNTVECSSNVSDFRFSGICEGGIRKYAMPDERV
jgi:hypothetical protein